jgi:hypothetical protein
MTDPNKPLTPEKIKEQFEGEVAFANHGKQVLANPAYKEAFALRKQQLFDTFSNTKPDQTEEREIAYLEMQNLKALEDYFTTILSTGNAAEISLTRYEE